MAIEETELQRQKVTAEGGLDDADGIKTNKATKPRIGK